MPLTLLQLVQTVQSELGLFPVATSVVANTDLTVQQLYYLANALGRDLVTERSWAAQQLTGILNPDPPITMTGTLTAGSAQVTGLSSTASLAPAYWLVSGTGVPSAARVYSVDSGTAITMDSEASASGTGVTLTFSRDRYDLPSDFDYFINQTQWDRTNHWPLIGPMSPQEDEWVRSGVVTTGPRRRFRLTSIYGGTSATTNRVIEIWPAPQTTDTPSTLAYEYVSNNWVRYLSGGKSTTRASFAADTDVCIFPDALMIAGLKYKFWSIKGFDTTALREEFDRSKQKMLAKDWGARTLDMRRRRSPYFLVPGNVQDANFPGP